MISAAAFTELNDSTDADLAKRWDQQGKAAQRQRFTQPESMLIYEVQTKKGETQNHLLLHTVSLFQHILSPSTDESGDSVEHDVRRSGRWIWSGNVGMARRWSENTRISVRTIQRHIINDSRYNI